MDTKCNSHGIASTDKWKLSVSSLLFSRKDAEGV